MVSGLHKYHFVSCHELLVVLFGDLPALIISIQTTRNFLAAIVHFPGQRFCVYSSVPLYPTQPTQLGCSVNAPPPSWLAFLLHVARTPRGSDRCLTSPSLSPRVRTLAPAAHTGRSERRTHGDDSRHTSTQGGPEEWDKHQHRFPRTNLPKRAGVGLSFFFFFKESHSSTHTPSSAAS